MDISGISSTAAGSTVKTGDSVAISVQKKAMDVQADAALQLIEAAKVHNTPTGSLGNHLDVYA